MEGQSKKDIGDRPLAESSKTTQEEPPKIPNEESQKEPQETLKEESYEVQDEAQHEEPQGEPREPSEDEPQEPSYQESPEKPSDTQFANAPPDYQPQYLGYPPTTPSPQTLRLTKLGYQKVTGGFGRYLTTDKLSILIVFGIFLMFLGGMIMTVVMASGPPYEWDDEYDREDDGYIDGNKVDDYYKDLRDYKSTRNIGIIIGGILLEFGVLSLVFALLGGGILNKELDNYTRLGMLIAAGIIVALELLFLSTIMTLAMSNQLNP